MPVTVGVELRSLSAAEFAQLAFKLMACVFEVHREMGRLFDERIYKREIARRFSGIQLEVPVGVSFDDFRKTYYLDMVVHNAAIFEVKGAEGIASAHRSQMLNYLLLCQLFHGKLINLRPEKVEHEFVNTTLTRQDRISFKVDDSDFAPRHDLDPVWHKWLVDAVRDWGTCLDIRLYQDAITHKLGGPQKVVGKVDVAVNGEILGAQTVRFAAPGTIFKVTMLDRDPQRFAAHASRFLACTSLDAIHWINIARNLVSFRTLKRSP